MTFPGPRAAWATWVAGAALAAAALVAPAWVAAAAATSPATVPPTTLAADGPTLVVPDQAFPDDAVAKGATFAVQGDGWPADVLVQLELCGNEARSGTSDCALATAQVVASNSRGTFEARLALVLPPSPCPCVVRALSQSSSDSAAAPIDIPGAPTAHPGDGDVAAPALRRLEPGNVALTGSDTLVTWIGGAPKRTFEFTLENTGSVAVQNATITLAAGPSDNPTGFVAPVRVDRMEVGEKRKFSVPIEFPNLSFGEQSVRATVNGTSLPLTFAASTTTHPWLLIIVPTVLLVQLLLVLIRNMVRRRLQDDDLPVTPITDPNAPADDALICVVELVTSPAPPPPAPEPPPVVVPDTVPDDLTDAVPADLTEASIDEAEEVVPVDVGPVHETVVMRSIAEVQQLVLDTLRVGDDGLPVATNGVQRSINTITVLADADARVGPAYHASDVLCAWVETTFAESQHPSARTLTLRRHVSAGTTNASAASGLGMVPLSVLVRAPHVRLAN